MGAGLATPGVDCFRNAFPAEVKKGVMIRVPLEGIETDIYIPGYHKARIQIATRHTDPVLGTEFANAVSKALTIQTRVASPANAERGAAFIDLFFPVTMPIQFPRLAGNGFEMSQHFNIVFGMEPNWM